jgi:hypothetical protein
MNWTSEYPTTPGFYWIRNYSLNQYGIYYLCADPTIAEVDKDLDFDLMGHESVYRKADLRQAEWQGPIEPNT